jgi:hypothetical protein
MACAAILTPWSAALAEERVKVTVVVILGTSRNADIDPKLKCVAREVQKVEPQLTGFQLGPATCKSLAVGNLFSFPLVEGQVADVIVQHAANEQDRVSLKVKPPQVGEITYTCACGKYFPIVTRYQTKAKDRLIVAIKVQPCKR